MSEIQYDPKKHVKMTDLSKELKITYHSLYDKQVRLNIKAIKVLDPSTNRKVVVFTKESAKKIRTLTAKPISGKRIPLKKLRQELNIPRGRLLKTLETLKISPKKMRIPPENRAVLTIASTSIARIKKALS